jgi:biopolymer transport protein ExbB
MNKKKIILAIVFMLFLTAFLSAEEQSLGKIDYVYLLRTSFVMMGLLLLSIVSLAFVLERFFYFRKIKCNFRDVMNKSESFIKENNFDSVLDICNRKQNPLNNTIKLIVENRDKSKSDLEELYEVLRSRERAGMEKFMVILGAGASVSPLLGLLGTVTGIMSAFASLAASGSGGPSVIAAGVAEALVTTAFGLIIGIPVLIVFNIFVDKTKVYLNEMDMSFRMLLFLFKKNN